MIYIRIWWVYAIYICVIHIYIYICIYVFFVLYDDLFEYEDVAEPNVDEYEHLVPTKTIVAATQSGATPLAAQAQSAAEHVVEEANMLLNTC